jgi:hypothetical protein
MQLETLTVSSCGRGGDRNRRRRSCRCRGDWRKLWLQMGSMRRVNYLLALLGAFPPSILDWWLRVRLRLCLRNDLPCLSLWRCAFLLRSWSLSRRKRRRCRGWRWDRRKGSCIGQGQATFAFRNCHLRLLGIVQDRCSSRTHGESNKSQEYGTQQQHSEPMCCGDFVVGVVKMEGQEGKPVVWDVGRPALQKEKPTPPYLYRDLDARSMITDVIRDQCCA